MHYFRPSRSATALSLAVYEGSNRITESGNSLRTDAQCRLLLHGKQDPTLLIIFLLQYVGCAFLKLFNLLADFP